ncbi:MAG TPA: FxSxx-COOH cyclophane-containing RiPP peptide [Actinospica sp.]|jgi:FXSXX-COOH protein|nr:FxSxx-COOH cyclophane-containing RiPP peptide [Actinospica sp.]
MNPTLETADTARIVVAGVADTRLTSLDRLVTEANRAVARSLRNVLPADESGRVPVAAFNASI